MADRDGVLRRVFAQLKVLASNPPVMPDEDDVVRYHALVDQLADLGYEVGDFRFNMERDLFARMIGGVSREKRNIRPDVFKNKVDALLTYFELEGSATPISFQAPRAE